MPFLSPALASPFPDEVELSASPDDAAGWYAEEKFDGHRLIVESLGPSHDQGPRVRAWSRDGKDRLLAPHLRQPLERLPTGIYDGELTVPGQRSYGVAALEFGADQKYVVFDVLRVLSADLTTDGIGAGYLERRGVLEEIYNSLWPTGNEDVLLIPSTHILSIEQVSALAHEVWARDGEGLILKHSHSQYRIGKRMKEWIKLKQLRSAVLTLVGFKEGKMGPYSVALLEDDDGNMTAVKWKDLEWLKVASHEWLGRKVRIEFQERTPDGSYRHPRWDRFEEEA